MKLEEDNKVNRMHESLQLFKEICNSDFFLNTSIILFFNKADIFKEKISFVGLNVCWSDYKGPNDYNEGTQFIQKKFEQQGRTTHKTIYSHITVATSTDNIKFVFEAVKDTIIANAISNCGMRGI
eukprot:TRINITY_DN5008_c0_g1_i2.p2 TRINITY_DN5008_c0_g1~~TRINITY_DN5008_c0_g1_i2.p2  ORF type:complete len:125 (+),score=13.27 TRINITY_DN5008_c0_g1_i2:936-1310(+)